MPAIAPKPLFLNDCTVQIGANSYEAAVSGVTFTPTIPTASYTGLTPTASYTHTGTPTWVAKIDYVQDWENPDSLSNYLADHAGEEEELTFIPKNGSGQKFTTTATLVPGGIGGTGNAYATDSVTLGCTNPERSAVPAATASVASVDEGQPQD